MMNKLFLILVVISFSCTEKVSLTERKISFSQLTEPRDNIYIELLSYYSASNEKESNFYVVKNSHNNDTLYVVDKDSLPIADFIKNYNGIENTAIILQKGKFKSKSKYFVNIPSNCNINNKSLYLGELIRLID